MKINKFYLLYIHFFFLDFSIYSSALWLFFCLLKPFIAVLYQDKFLFTLRTLKCNFPLFWVLFICTKLCFFPHLDHVYLKHFNYSCFILKRKFAWLYIPCFVYLFVCFVCQCLYNFLFMFLLNLVYWKPFHYSCLSLHAISLWLLKH